MKFIQHLLAYIFLFFVLAWWLGGKGHCQQSQITDKPTMDIVKLDDDDAAVMKDLHERMEQLQKLWDRNVKQFKEKYLVVDPKDPLASDSHYYGEDSSYYWLAFSNCDASCEKSKLAKFKNSKRIRKGWESLYNCSNCGPRDFEFSTDWRYIFPKTVTAPVTTMTGCWVPTANYSTFTSAPN